MIKRFKRRRPLAPEPANYKFGFVVLSPDANPNLVNLTRNSIAKHYPGMPTVVSVPATKVAGTMPAVVGGDTITSLINAGVKASTSPWCVVVFEGCWIQPTLYRIFDQFVTSPRDILFPVVDGHTNFIDGCMNGLILTRTALAEIGEFPEHAQKFGYNDLKLAKLLWANWAMEKGYKIKAIVGIKI